MLVRETGNTIEDEQAIFFMTIANNMTIRILNFNSRLNVSEKKVNIILIVDKVGN